MTINVYVNLKNQTIPAGTMFSYVRRGRESTTFRYESEYVASVDAYSLEPAMPLGTGEYAFPQGLPHSFRDASPDRWGRMLIEKGLRQQWLQNNEPPRTITEVDYLLNTSDVTRQGALRFKRPGSNDYEAEGKHIPKLLALPELLAASQRFCTDDGNNPNALAAIKTLLDAGTASLGGARPKSSVIDESSTAAGVLYMAKFPHPGDQWEIMRWEKVALDLAKDAGITVPENRLVAIDDAAVLLLRRFDRTDAGQRIGFISAMTLLEKSDGESGDYLDLADALSEISISASSDLTELWRRILFSIAINNTDDHLRNHAFLQSASAWALSPAFDINPNPDLNSARVTGISGETTFAKAWEAALEVRELFGISDKAAGEILKQLRKSLYRWRTIAQRNGVTESELRLFAPLFERSIEAAELSCK
ncbi:MAG: type II toxin-antitoxin system HipA family toxin [Coriobacteriia bacterium]|nr:type II toxin-antitoxin system HipA family toxin [Coriobacteriia bacterium]